MGINPTLRILAFFFLMLYNTKCPLVEYPCDIAIYMSGWRNWQTRTFEGRVG